MGQELQTPGTARKVTESVRWTDLMIDGDVGTGGTMLPADPAGARVAFNAFTNVDDITGLSFSVDGLWLDDVPASWSFVWFARKDGDEAWTFMRRVNNILPPALSLASFLGESELDTLEVMLAFYDEALTEDPPPLWTEV